MATRRRPEKPCSERFKFVSRYRLLPVPVPRAGRSAAARDTAGHGRAGVAPQGREGATPPLNEAARRAYLDTATSMNRRVPAATS